MIKQDVEIVRMLPRNSLSVNKYTFFFNFADRKADGGRDMSLGPGDLLFQTMAWEYYLTIWAVCELPLNIAWWPRYWTFVSCFLPLLQHIMHCNTRMILQPWGRGGSSNGLIFLEIFTNKVQLSDFLFFPPPKGRCGKMRVLFLSCQWIVEISASWMTKL